MPFVFSTLTGSQLYTKWTKNPDGANLEGPSVLIKGGHGLMDNRTLITPLGVVTEVSNEELEILNSIPDFQDHVKAGFLIVQDKNSDPEKVAADMQHRDESAQLTESDFKANGRKAPKTSK